MVIKPRTFASSVHRLAEKETRRPQTVLRRLGKTGGKNVQTTVGSRRITFAGPQGSRTKARLHERSKAHKSVAEIVTRRETEESNALDAAAVAATVEADKRLSPWSSTRSTA